MAKVEYEDEKRGKGNVGKSASFYSLSGDSLNLPSDEILAGELA